MASERGEEGRMAEATREREKSKTAVEAEGARWSC